MTEMVVLILLSAAFGIAVVACVFLVRLVRRRRRPEKPSGPERDAGDVRTW